MTTAQTVGAVSSEAGEWYAIDWQAIHRNVRRLQVRIVKAVREGRWGKVRALQRLLTHSYSGKVLAVRRVTENDGKKTPGVDQEIWDTPEKTGFTANIFPYRSRVSLKEKRERSTVRGIDGGAGRRSGRKRRLLCNGADIGCVRSIDNITERKSGQTSPWCCTRENLINRLRRQSK